MKGPRHQIDQCVMFLYAFTHFLTRNFKSSVLLFKTFIDLFYKNSQPDFLLVVFLGLILFFISTKGNICHCYQVYRGSRESNIQIKFRVPTPEPDWLQQGSMMLQKFA